MFETLYQPVEKTHPFTPCFLSWIYSSKLDIDTQSTVDLLLELEPEILKLPAQSDGATSLGPNSTTSRHRSYNLLAFDHPLVHQLKKEIRRHYHLCLRKCKVKPSDFSAPHDPYLQCWYNIMRTGDRISEHAHKTGMNICSSHVSGNVCLTNCAVKTIYHYEGKDFEFQSKANNITLFPMYVRHETTQFEEPGERVTIAFDIIPYRPTNQERAELQLVKL